jgi:hypothetical protein
MLSDDTRQKLKISLQKMLFRGTQISAQQSETSFAAALQQAERLKKTSKVSKGSRRTGNIP